MTDADPLSTWNADHRAADDAAFAALRGDLARRSASELAALESLRRLHHDQAIAAARASVPARRGSWTPADRQAVLSHLASILHDTERAQAAFGDEGRLHRLWDDGAFRSVERMCEEASVHAEGERPEELGWLLESWSDRRTSRAAGVASVRAAEARRRRRVAAEQQAQIRRRRAAGMRGWARRGL